jgi:DedD protein
VAWVLQVASVSTREKADALVAQLISADYKAYHRVLRKDGKELYRVYVGPVFERGAMLEAKRDVDRRLKVTSIVTRYIP